MVEVWNGFLLGKAKKEDVSCRFCGKREGDGHLFWECSFLPLQHVRELPEFASLMSLDRSNWPRCLLWHGWLPGLSSLVLRTPGLPPLVIWRLFNLNDVLVRILLILLVPRLLLSIGMLLILPWRCLSTLMSGLVVVERISLLLGVLRLLVLVCMPASELVFDGLIWGTAEEYGDARLERCRAFMLVPGVMQTVQRPEFWGDIVALQAYWPCHLGIDNLNVARSVGRLLDHDSLAKPLPLVKDGDLIALARYMIRTSGSGH